MNAALSNPFMIGKRKPIVVGHRGVPARHQENTLAGFKRAVQLGVPAIELDVQLTRLFAHASPGRLRNAQVPPKLIVTLGGPML